MLSLTHSLKLQIGYFKIYACSIEIGKAIFQEGTLLLFCYVLAMSILPSWFRSGEFFEENHLMAPLTTRGSHCGATSGHTN